MMKKLNKMKLKCSFCKNKRWSYQETPRFIITGKNPDSLDPFTEKAAGFSYSYETCVSLICQKCGHVVFFDKTFLDDIAEDSDEKEHTG